GRAEPNAGVAEDVFGRLPRRVEVLRRKARELRYPAADIVPGLVEFLALGDRVEDAERGLGVKPAAGGPLPARVVVRPVPVHEVREVVSLAVAVIDHEIFDQEARGDHPRAVRDEALGEELTRGRIHDRVTGLPLAKGAKSSLVVHPWKALELATV